MKIDFVISNLGGDGAQRVVCSLANYFAEIGESVRIITYRDGDKYLLHKNVKRIKLHTKLRFFDTNLSRIFWHLYHFYKNKKNRPDIISSHLDTLGLVTIPITIIYRIKLVVSEHNNHLAEKITVSKWFLWNVLYRFPDAVTILTKFDQEYFNTKNRRVVIMPNPVPFVPQNEVTTRNNKTIVAVGNLDRYHQKGFDNLLEIVADVCVIHKDWKFMLIGEGKKGLAFLKSKAKKLHVEENLVFSGYRSDIQQIFKDSEIFILSSRYEGLPMVLIEAASQGIACVAYDCISGPSEVIKDGVSGILVENQNNKKMADTISSLIVNKQLRIELGTQAALSVRKFSLEVIGLKWQQLFNDILQT